MLMKLKTLYYTIVCCIGLIVTGCQTTTSSTTAWEYHVEIVQTVEPHSQSLQTRLNELGRDGWALVQVSGEQGQFRVILRRPKR